MARLQQTVAENNNNDPASCTPAMYTTLQSSLSQADEQCMEFNRRLIRDTGGETSNSMKLCLEYFLENNSPPYTLNTACPCIYAYAEEISPQMSHWMVGTC